MIFKDSSGLIGSVCGQDMKSIRREILTWTDVDRLIDHLVPQFDLEFDGMVLITRGGIIPGGLLAQALDLRRILTAAVDFPEIGQSMTIKSSSGEEFDPGLYAWPFFLQFPEDRLLSDQRILVVDDVWGSGRTIMAVRSRVVTAGGQPYTCVLHYNPALNRFSKFRPDFYAAVTDAFIVYPWEINHGLNKVLQGSFDKDR